MNPDFKLKSIYYTEEGAKDLVRSYERRRRRLGYGARSCFAPECSLLEFDPDRDIEIMIGFQKGNYILILLSII